MVHQVTPNVSSFSGYLELIPDFGYIFVGPSDIISVAVSDIRPLRKPIYIFALSLEALSS